MTLTAREVIAGALPASRHVLHFYDRPGGPPGNSRRAATDDEQAGAILAALDAAGMVVVPKEPSNEMVDAGEHALIGTDAPLYVSGDIYRAMMEAASPGYTERRNALKENR